MNASSSETAANGAWLAKRTYTGTNEHGQIEVVVEIGHPVPDIPAAGGDFVWRCPMRFTVHGTATTRDAGGVDCLQSLRVAIETVRAFLDRLAQAQGYRFTFLGIPVDPSSSAAWSPPL